jgi:hypothetical protein
VLVTWSFLGLQTCFLALCCLRRYMASQALPAVQCGWRKKATACHGPLGGESGSALVDIHAINGFVKSNSSVVKSNS